MDVAVRNGWLTRRDGSDFKLTDGDKLEILDYWQSKGGRGRVADAAPRATRADGARGRAYHLDNLLNDISNNRGNTKDTNPLTGHQPTAHSVNAPQADAPTAAAAPQTRQAGPAARSTSPACTRWCEKLAALFAELRFDPELAAEVKAYNLAQGLVEQGYGGPDEVAAPPVVPSKNNPTGRSPAELALPQTQDQAPELESFIPHKPRQPDTLESVVSTIKSKGRR
jgi:hypothetical protein